jgi:hypothetical protein
MDLLVLMLVVGLLGGDDRSIGDQGEVDPGVGNSVKSTLRAPSKQREAVMEDTIWPSRRLRLV